ncbi:uncharacterized protein LOC121984369 isoform X2 [Zingiber officinale]|uniref:uncharacterized protein LOC121984369 isoform X2 n=1 Tax=Zingiber officinale TaxID=94328 RepID=UPI001C4B8711|nr:uncharacterized protein LOC121984369 isoform X2 [Zingiber officinale]
MVVEIGADSVLDYALFNISSAENSYEVFICKGGKLENIACGPLNQLAIHLAQVKKFQSNLSFSKFKLELTNNIKSSSWFTKFTLTSFLGIINSPDVVRTATAIVNEMSQLEDTRRFHLSLYFKSHSDHAGDTTAGGHFEGVGPTNTEIEAEASDATKNELLRAIELRIVGLKEELVALFSQAAGATLSVKHLSDLAKFSQHFQVRDLRDALSKYLSLISEEQLSESSVKAKDFDGSKKNPEDPEDIIEGMYPSNALIGRPNTSAEGISPAKIAQVERMSLTESDNSSESTNEDQTVTERSRPIMRSVTPRRSASPMRRVQIGRSGSRRSTALSIKSLSYFPAREKILTAKDADENNSGDEQTDQPARKSENTVRRMSVQEAISLFESKQKDNNLDAQKRIASGDSSVINNKTVLRRWNSGLTNSLAHGQGNAYEPVSQSSCVLHVEEDNKMIAENIDSFTTPADLNTASETTQIASLPKIETAAVSKDVPSELASSQTAEIDGATTSADWGKHKEAELNQMLMKMIESKPGKYIDSNTGSGGSLSTSNKQKGGFYSQYTAKRDEKLRAENANKHLAMEQKLKVLQETLKPSKTELVSKSGVTAKKFDSLVRSQRPRRNSSPPVLPKKEVSKLEVSKQTSVKPSSLSTTRASWSSGSLPKTSGAQPVKSSSKVSSDTTPSRRRSHLVSPTPPSPKIEKPLHQPREESEAKTDTKRINRVQGEKKHKTPVSTKITVKAKNPTASPDESGSSAAKPSFYDKVTKKGSVVPLEAKSARKFSGTGRVGGRSLTKSRIIQSDASSKKSDNSIQVEEKEQTPEIIDKVLEADLAEQANDLDANLVTSLDNCLNLEKTETGNQSLADVDVDVNHNSLEIPVAEIQPDEDISISSAAWVELEQCEVSTAYDTGLTNASVSNVHEPSLVSSPRVRHSLSQMLQADSNEPDVIEWGNAENPPALIYHKDSPKGLKRLLKFARKNKGEANVTGYASPSVNSEGEEDAEDPKATCKKNFDTSRRTSLQEKRYSQLKTMVNEGLLDGNSSKRTGEYQGVHDVLSGSSATMSTKARSFFSLSTFRSSKSNETKPR